MLLEKETFYFIFQNYSLFSKISMPLLDLNNEFVVLKNREWKIKFLFQYLLKN